MIASQCSPTDPSARRPECRIWIFGAQEDARLIQLVQEFGPANWSSIAQVITVVCDPA